MIEQFLQTALEFIKEIWFQLDSRFGLEDTEAFKFLKPYLIQLQDNPLYMGISLAALFLVPYALIKVKNISRERERKLDKLMEEMEEEEEYDEDDPRRLRRPEPEMGSDEAKPLFENDKDAPPSYMKVLDEMEGKDVAEDDFESELEEFELESPSSDNEEAIDLEKNTETISSQLTENEFEKDLNEFMSDDIDMEKKDVELHLDDSEHGQAIKDLLILDKQEAAEALAISPRQLESVTKQLQEESPSISELSDSETLASLKPENALDLESMLEPEAEPETKPETESEAISDTRDYEPEPSGFTLATESMALEEIQEPESDAELPPLADKFASPRKTDSLIDQLKFLQTRFENRYQQVERPSSPIEKNIPAKSHSSASFIEPSVTQAWTSPINIIAVGGGKGGIGKSVICTNLAAGMALSGQKVILMDTDFGASNLHALLGISNPDHGFQDFFNDDIIDPETLLLDTGISNLKFVSGQETTRETLTLIPRV